MGLLQLQAVAVLPHAGKVDTENGMLPSKLSRQQKHAADAWPLHPDLPEFSVNTGVLVPLLAWWAGHLVEESGAAAKQLLKGFVKEALPAGKL
eukprot:2393714-Lingulodinium_polyedra.AAC.1